jgi:hypothetical protein
MLKLGEEFELLLKSLFKPVIVYENINGAYGNITLTDTAANYTYFEIYFSANDGPNYQSSVKISAPNGKTISLIYALNDDSANIVYYKTKNMLITGNKINNVAGRYSDTTFFNGANPVITKVDHIKIHKVLGYKA